MKTDTTSQRSPTEAITPTPPASAAPESRPAALGLEARMAAASQLMDARLAEAAVAYEVNTSHIPTEPLVLADVVTGPIDIGPAPRTDLYPTPVAAVLQRAHHRLLAGGWCKDVLVDADGARCLLGAIRAETRGDTGLEAGAVAVLMDAVRREFGDVDSVPGFNDAWTTGRVPVRMVDQAANLADARGL